ncbi:phage integrase Arm DNA-binding domain-containing protein [Salinispirillum sp. LH 10-3-1]|uniref:Phage integrase Arm DNA-binding domain-containing protein n=1 Tax=Salinispirillum sp. LH 10-3-1 TaxID=2952525 RepID=A0AB38YC30_9GAMM
MAPRRRSRNTANLPPNLYIVAGKYYQYRRPTDGKRFGMGTDKARAVAAAQQLNSMLVSLPGAESAVERATRPDTLLMRDFIKHYYEKLLPKRKLAEKSQKMHHWKRKYIAEALGNYSVDEIDVRDVAKFLGGYPPTTSNQYRALLVDIFRHAVAEGYCRENPAELTIPQIGEKRRKRMTVEQYQAIHAASALWLQNAMDLALLTLQRRGDVVAMRWENVREGALYVIQEKTKKHDTGYLRIIIGPELDAVIKRCRDSVPSPFLVHRRPITQHKAQRDALEHWTQVRGDFLQKAFAKVRDSLPELANMTAEERPTFHEIRALGIKLYRDAGQNPQHLAGHAQERMTKNYEAGHDEIRWVEAVASGLTLPLKTTV